MNNEMSRYIKVNNWIFEVKNIRAIRVNSYGEPYSGIANICVNSDSAYVDGIMTKEVDDFTHEDYLSFVAFCRQLGMSNVNFSGYIPPDDNVAEFSTADVSKEESNLFSKSA